MVFTLDTDCPKSLRKLPDIKDKFDIDNLLSIIFHGFKGLFIEIDFI